MPYQPLYQLIFNEVKVFVEGRVPNVSMMHIGSTAVFDLRGKPMIDTIAVVHGGDLIDVRRALEKLGFHRRDVWTDIETKPYVCASIMHERERFNINIHICKPDYPLVQDAVRFIKLLNENTEYRRAYEKAKDDAHHLAPANSEIYNQSKEETILKILDAAK